MKTIRRNTNDVVWYYSMLFGLFKIIDGLIDVLSFGQIQSLLTFKSIRNYQKTQKS